MKHLFLGAALACLAAATAAQSPVTTTMIGGLVLGSYAGANTIYLDVDVTSPTGIVVQQIDLRTQLGPTGTCSVLLTALGVSQATNRANPAAWTQAATGVITAVGTSMITLTPPLVLPFGSRGMAIHVVTAQAVYTNGATQVPPLPTSFSTAEVTLNCIDARIQNSTPAQPIGGGVSAVRTPNITMHYSTATLDANFTATPPTTGNAPFPVQFNDASFSTAPGGITVWAWDFDGDSTIDSNAQNPLFVYTACGTYTVSLTVFDITGNATETKANFVVVDPLAASFTWAKIGNPAVFQFTNTSSTSAATFSWDLDGDTIPDSTAPNPVFSYPLGCSAVNVTLAVTNSCRNATITRQVVPMPTMTTLYNSNNSGGSGWGNFFDVNVTNPDGVSMCGMSMSMLGAAGVPFTADIYARPGTYVGFDHDQTAWTLIASGSGVTGGTNAPSAVSFPPIYLSPGSRGFAVYVTGAGPAYSGTGTSPLPGAATYSNADMALSLGVSRNGLFGAAVTQFNPRIWNGSIHYRTVDQGLAVYQVFGSGCPGSLGVPGNVGTSLPVLGQTMTNDYTNLPFNIAFQMLGFSRTMSGFGPLPLDLAGFGAPNCSARVSADVVLLLLATNNVATFSWSLPAAPVFVGARFYNQALVFDSVNPLGATVSDAAMIILGQ